MSNHAKRDHWQSLASDLGADVPPEKDPADPQASEEESKKPEAASGSESAPAAAEGRQQQRPRAARSRANWMELAEQLGVLPSETPPPRPPETPAEPLAAMPPLPSISDELPAPTDWLDRDLLAEPPEEVASRGPVEQAGGADDSEDEQRAIERKLPRKRKKRRRRSREARAAAELSEREKKTEGVESVPGPEVAEEPVGDATDVEPITEGASETERADLAADTPRRKRRPRGGRKKSPTRKRAAVKVPEKDSDEESSDEPPAAEEPSREQDKKKRSKKKEPQRGPKPQKTAGSSHRGIPSWEEAVGIVIEANLGTRSKKTSGDSSSRGRGGRGRGGKDKKGSNKAKSK